MTALFDRPTTSKPERTELSATPSAIASLDQRGGERTPVVHTMPSKFHVQLSRGGGSSRTTQLTIVLLFVVLAGAVGAYFFLRGKQQPTNTNVTVNDAKTTNANNANNATNGTTNANGNGNTNAIASTIVTATYLDPGTKLERGTATLTIPEGALPTTVTTAALTALSPSIGAYATDTNHVAVGGVFLLLPAGTKLRSTVSLTVTYTDRDLIEGSVKDEASDLSLASWNGTAWTPFTSVVDADENSVSADITEFYTDGVAVVYTKATPTNTNTGRTTNTAVTVTPSLDSDADGLTNQEETLYGTNASASDTDGDTYKDGAELLALYNPNGAGRLADTTFVQQYANAAFAYTMFVPKGWTIGALDGDNIVTFTTITGEFVQASVLDNPSHLSAREWYLTLNPSIPASSLLDTAVGTLVGIVGPDHLNVFLADAAHIYQLTYNIGIREEANYVATFTMMYSSFRVSATATNGNANGNANTNAASNANGSS